MNKKNTPETWGTMPGVKYCCFIRPSYDIQPVHHHHLPEDPEFSADF